MNATDLQVIHPNADLAGNGVSRFENPDQRTFETHMRPLGKPMVVTGWMADWACMNKWTFDFFKEKCGQDQVAVAISIKHTYYTIQIPLADYVDYILDKEGTGLARMADMFGMEHPFYCFSNKPFVQYPELLEDFALPDFIGDWFRYFNKGFKRLHFPQMQGWIHLGKKGVVSELHTDSASIMTCLAQVEGLKRFVLYSPKDTPYLYNGKVNPFNPDFEKYPLYKKAKPIVVDLKAGEMIFLPPNWWHHVVALESSVTLVWPLVNHLNLGDYLLHSYKGQMGKFLASIPGMLPPRPQPAEPTVADSQAEA